MLRSTTSASWLVSAPRFGGSTLARGYATGSAPTGVVMMNLGGPATDVEVEPFLRRLFSDREIVQLPIPEALQVNMVGPLIAKRRAPSIIEQYKKIGGGSPIRKWTEKQGAMMVQHLDKLSPETAPHKFYIAFRYAPPLTAETLQQMRADGIKRAVAFTQYPQWSCTTTGSSLNELWRQIRNLGADDIEWSIIDRWPVHPSFIKVLTKKVQEGLALWTDPKEREDVIILFSAHSLPMKVVNRGDAYPQEVGATVQKVMEALQFSHRYSLCYQSQVGPVPWLGPQTAEVVERLGKRGHKNVLVVPVAFTSDHVETLYELDIEVGHIAKEHGVTNYKRAPALNDDPLMGEGLAHIVRDHLEAKELHGRQYLLRCAACINPQCRNLLHPAYQQVYQQPPLSL
ncbi:Ferrochelatase [Balamuthia mandrillaris]